MRIAVPNETTESEKRVALTPDAAKALVGKGFEVVVQAGAGNAADCPDSAYEAAGANVLPSVSHEADLTVRVGAPSLHDIGELPSNSALISFLFPANNPHLVRELANRHVSAFAMDQMPRITRAQSMDAISAMSTIAGYKGALLAANSLSRFFPMLMTAAGTISPARVFVIGAGVAGLQAIATCKRLGAVVEAFDVRPAVKEQVESLGAKFVALEVATDEAQDASGYAKEVSADTHLKELELIGLRMARCDVVIATALIPGRPAPVLITRDMVKKMSPGSVIVDLAAPNGGNCEATIPGQSVIESGVKVLGPTALLSEMAADASQMYARNIVEFLTHLAPGGNLKIDMEDQITRETLVTYDGKIVHEPTRVVMEREGKE